MVARFGREGDTSVAELSSMPGTTEHPATSSITSLGIPAQPWQRVHIDYAELQGRHYLVVVDAHSKWPEIVAMGTSTAAATADPLRKIFAVHGLPAVLASDNGSQFTAEEFRVFCQQNGIRQAFSSPFHPLSNGAAERVVQLLKQFLRKQNHLTPKQSLASFLLTYRTTAHATTGRAPCELLMGRMLRTRLDLLHPQPLATRVADRQEAQVNPKSSGMDTRTFQAHQTVYARDYRAGQPKWS